MTDQKTPAQLRREINYYAGVIQRTHSRDRILRAHVAIRVRERQLADAMVATPSLHSVARAPE